MGEEIMDDKEEQSEERRAVRVGQKKTVTPTLAEREGHERTHIPCQSWCRHYVAARASNPARRGRKFTKAVEDDKDMRQVSFDYFVMRDQPGLESAKILVSKDRATRMVSAHVVPLTSNALEIWSDWDTLRGSRGTLSEYSPVADSQSKGFFERGIRSVEEMTKVVIFDLSRRVGSPISASVSVNCRARNGHREQVPCGE